MLLANISSFLRYALMTAEADSGGRSKSIVADDRVIRRNGNARGVGHGFAILLELAQVLAGPWFDAHKLQVHQHLVHLGVAHALTNAAGSRMHHFGSGDKSRHGISDGKPSVAMAVPLYANVLARRFHYFVYDEVHQRERAHRSSVSGGVADDDSVRTAINGIGVQPPDRFWIAACRVFGDIHHFEAKRNAEFHRFF